MSSSFYHFRRGRPVVDERRRVATEVLSEVDGREEGGDLYPLDGEARARAASEVLAETEGSGGEGEGDVSIEAAGEGSGGEVTAKDSGAEVSDALLRELGMDKLKLDLSREEGRKQIVKKLISLLAAKKITVRQLGQFNRKVLVPLFGPVRASSR